MLETTKPLKTRNWRVLARTFFSFVFTRGFVVWLLLLIEIALVILLINNFFAANTLIVYALSLVFSVGAVIYLCSQSLNASFKLAWAIFILVASPVGGIIYFLYEVGGIFNRRQAGRLEMSKLLSLYLRQNSQIMREVRRLPPGPRQQMQYLSEYENFPVYNHTRTQYYPLGEKFFTAFKKDLESAQKFIFLEYYIVTPGLMWNQILEILQRKAREGVEVRVMYDDFGSLFSLPTNYGRQLAKLGIKTRINNRFRPLIAFQMNNRDHRKIAVIDGRVGYTGGLNLADEYINAINRYGHWKDTAVRLEGVGVNSLTVIFMQQWHADKKSSDVQVEPYLVRPEQTLENDGLVVPFSCEPWAASHVGKNVYLNLINKAEHYIYATTPYLVPDDELMTALRQAARNGVDVRLVIPNNGDHWYVHTLSQAFCLPLIEAGVQVYEYTPGFMHSKTMLVDGQQAVIGSINLDFRSLYMLYESAVYVYGSQAAWQLEQDFLETCKECRHVELADVKEVKITTRLIRSLLRLFAPLA